MTIDKTPDEVANEAIMTRKVCEALILLVEGFNDEKVYQKFLATEDSEIISSWGKDNVLGAITILENEEIRGILGIVDADFWHLEGRLPTSPNVIVTDGHDLEMMMIYSKSFSHFITEVASATKMESFLRSHDVKDIRDILLDNALPIGLLRKYSYNNDLKLCFNKIKFASFINRETMKIEINKMVEVVLSLTRNPALNLSEIIRQVNIMLNSRSDDPYQVCCGHDVIEILGIGLRKCIGSKSKEASSIEMLESGLRMSYDSACFQKTKLYFETKKWSLNNSPYQVFA